MKPLIRWLVGPLSLPCYGLFTQWMRTLDARVVLYDQRVDPAYPESNRIPRIYTFWHEAIMAPLYHRGRCGLTMMLSQHDDAEILRVLGERLGFGVIRGSTGRTGSAAARQIFDRGLRHGEHITFAVDGPRGPRHTFPKGTVYVAARSGMPIIPMGWAYDRPWRLRRAWDRFAVPRPFSRLRAVVGPEIFVPDTRRDTLEHFRSRLETLQRQLTVLAEEWATSGRRYADEYTLSFGPAAPL